MSNEIVKGQTQAPAKTTENITIESLLASGMVKSLATTLKLTDVQLAKANNQVLRLMTDEKLEGTTQISKVRFCYEIASLNYKNPNAVAPIKYGTAIQAQMQYQAFIEDMLECGGVEETNAVLLFEGVDYKPIINKLGFTELTLPDQIVPKSLFEKPKVIGYYAYAKCKDGRVATCLMSVADAQAHAKKYSKAYSSGRFSPYTTDPDKMFLKATIKSVAREVLKWFPFDRLAKSITIDQSVYDTNGVSYADNANNEKIELPPEKKTNIDNKIVIPQEIVEEQKAEVVDTQDGKIVDADGVVVDKQ